jgi:DNA invertase Pin-like site-specific DNA recombinase
MERKRLKQDAKENVARRSILGKPNAASSKRHIEAESGYTNHRNVAYLRVSTDHQELDSQKLGILNFADANKIKPLEFVQETASGGIPVEKRRLGELITELKEGDILIVSEISRLGRNMVEIMTVLKGLVDRRVNVFSVKENYRLDDSLNSKILSTVLCMVAEISRELTRARVKEGMSRAKQAGKKMGRPAGLPARSKLDPHEAEIRGLLTKGVSKASIAKIHNTTWQTVHAFTKRMGVQPIQQKPKQVRRRLLTTSV